MRTHVLPAVAVPCLLVAALTSLTLLSGCGFGTAGVTAAASGGGGTAPADPVVTSLQAPRSPTSPATVAFVLVTGAGARVNASLQYRTAGSGSFQPATLAAGSPGLLGLTGNATAPYQVQWNFAADLGGQQYTDGIELRLAIQGGNAVTITDVAQGNDAPQLTDVQPAPLGAAEYSANTDMRFTFADSAQDPVDVRIEFNADAAGGFPSGGWELARPAATPSSQATPNPQVGRLGASATPEEFEFRWDTARDLAGFDSQVQMRVTLTDHYGASTTALSAPFQVDNNQPPIAALQGEGFVNNSRNRGVIPIPFQVIDPEGDPVRVAVQWTPDGQPFPSLPATAAGLLDLLDNPSKASDRKLAQIATQYLPRVEGRVGTLAGLSPTEVRLPELASSGAQLLAEGLGGATLEVRRLSDAPSPVAWASSPLVAPVAVLAGDDAYTALVLDQGGSGWRLRVVDLETGTVVRSLGSGGGTPRSLALDPTGARVFVGTQVGIHRLDRGTGAQLDFLAHDFADGPRGLAAISSNTVIASGDSRLVRCNVEAGTRADVLTGLANPFGVARDPLDDQRVYFAETGTNRVRRFDLDRRAVEAVTANVAVADQATLGTVAFPSPRGIALENNGARLLVMTTFSSTSSLRALEVGTSSTIYQVTSGLATTGGAIGVGPDRLRMVPLAASNALAVGGGASARRTLIALPPAGSPAGQSQPYDPARQVVRLTAPFASPLTAGTMYRLVRSVAYLSTATGGSGIFRWNTDADVFLGSYRVRVVPIDGDQGTANAGFVAKPISTFPPTPTILAVTEFSDPATAAAADLNGDGRTDFVSAARSGSGLFLFLQTPEGTFPATPTTLATGSGTSSVAAADLNGDGRVDLVATERIGNRLFLFVQTTAGTMPSIPTTLTTGTDPTSVVAADLNGDGRIDLVSADTNSNRLSLFVQTTSGTFPTTPTTLTTGSTPQSVAVSDLNGDGRIDLVSADTNSNRLSLFLQSPAGTFPAIPTTLTTGSSPQSVAAADLNGDGRIDLASADAGSNRLSLFLQTPAETFPTTPQAITVGAGVISRMSIAANDLNGDGRIDLATALSGFTSSVMNVSIHTQTPAGAFPTTPTTLANGSGIGSVVPADLNGDGRIDLLAVNPSADRLLLFQQSSIGNLAPTATSIATGSSPESIAAADLNGDGLMDIVSADANSNRLSLFAQNVTGGFTSTPTTLATGSGTARVAAIDINGDGRIDIASAAALDNSLSLFLQTPAATYPSSPITLTTGARPLAIASADINSDGRIDIVSADANSNRLSLYLQSQMGTFPATPTTLPTGSFPVSIAAIDLNADGRIDLVSADRSSNRLSLFLQTPTGTYPATPSTLATGTSPSAVAAADVNGDGRIDLVSADRLSNRLSLFVQNSAGSFPATPATLTTGFSPDRVAAADINGDGRIDLVVADSTTTPNATGRITIFLQDFSGAFPATPTTLTVTPNLIVSAIATADIDGDGCIDIVSADSTDRIRVFVNY
jgi:hypothetical protein